MLTQQPLVGQGLLIIEAWRLHSDTPHSVRLLWTSDQADAETCAWQRTTLTRDRHPCPPAGLETIISASERPQTHVSDRTATGIGKVVGLVVQYTLVKFQNLVICSCVYFEYLRIKINLSLWTPWRRMGGGEAYFRSLCTSAQMHVSGKLHTSAAEPSGKDLGTHWMWSWLGSRAGLDGFVVEKKLVHLLRFNFRTI